MGDIIKDIIDVVEEHINGKNLVIVCEKEKRSDLAALIYALINGTQNRREKDLIEKIPLVIYNGSKTHKLYVYEVYCEVVAAKPANIITMGVKGEYLKMIENIYDEIENGLI